MPSRETPLSDIAAALADGKLLAADLVAEAIDRRDGAAEDLGAYQTWNPEQALENARIVDSLRRVEYDMSALAGIPMSVKDLFGVAGHPTYGGTAERLPPEWELEGFLIRRLREAFCIVLGKTKMVELAFGGLGQNPHWGTPINPWSSGEPRVPGGSSCGAGVSLWQGSARVALGTDTACSVRVPASMTGTVGFKVTRGRWPTSGLVPLSPTLDSLGFLTQTVADAAFFFNAIDPVSSKAGRLLDRCEKQSLNGLRIGLDPTHAWSECEPGISEAVMAALKALEAQGASIVEISFPEFNAANALYMEGKIVPPEVAAFVENRLPDWLDRLDPLIGDRIRGASQVAATEYLGALSRRRHLIAAAAERMRQVDALATPTVTISPPLLSDVEDLENYMRANRLASRTTNPANVLDLCAISMPCGLDNHGMPIGLQLTARSGDDEFLLSYAYAAERALGTVFNRLGTPARLS